VIDSSAHSATGIVERIEADVFLKVTRSAELPLRAQSVSAALDRKFALWPGKMKMADKLTGD